MQKNEKWMVLSDYRVIFAQESLFQLHIMDAYISIKVGLSTKAHWYDELRRCFPEVKNWKYHFHFTTIYMTDFHEDMIGPLDQELGRLFASHPPVTFTFNKVDAFDGLNARKHIVNLTGDGPDTEFMGLIEAIRSVATKFATKTPVGFIPHVTLAEIEPNGMSLDEVKRRLAAIHVPTFTLTLSKIERKTRRPNLDGMAGRMPGDRSWDLKG